jgi:hypothetical protein
MSRVVFVCLFLHREGENRVKRQEMR